MLIRNLRNTVTLSEDNLLQKWHISKLYRGGKKEFATTRDGVCQLGDIYPPDFLTGPSVCIAAPTVFSTPLTHCQIMYRGVSYVLYTYDLHHKFCSVSDRR